MDASLVLEIIAIAALIFANAFFVLSEFAIISSRKSRLKQLVEDGHSGAAAAEKLHAAPERFLAGVQVAITLLGTLAAVFGGATIVEKLERWLATMPVEFIAHGSQPIAVGIVAISLTIVSVVLGELVPKYLAMSNPETCARLVARPVSAFLSVTSIFARMLSGLAGIIVRALGIRHDPKRGAVSEEEINMMVLDGRQKGIFDETEERLIRSVFSFADSTVRRVMTPRTDVIGIELSTPAEQIIHSITEHGYSRFPVYEKSIDNIVGVLYTKDVIFNRMDPYLIILKDLVREPMFVPSSMELSRLLHEFQRRKQHMAIVLDEFGGTDGLVTLEDILEELVGEIQDEYDTESTPLVKQSDTVAFADGSVWPGAVNNLMKTNLPEDEADTLAGVVIDHIGRVPEKDDVIDILDLRITIVRKEKNRLTRLKLERLPEDI
jgi:putative hemolysin